MKFKLFVVVQAFEHSEGGGNLAMTSQVIECDTKEEARTASTKLKEFYADMNGMSVSITPLF